jgi:hypothetical protein
MGNAWAIKDWDTFYEVKGSHRPTREVVYHWVAFPTKHDGKSYRRLTRHVDGERAMLAFVMMVEVAAKMPKRGVLADENGPLTAEDLSDMTGWEVSLFELGFKLLSNIRINWIESVACPDKSGVVGSSPATLQDITRQDRKICVEPPKATPTPADTRRPEEIPFPEFPTSGNPRTWLLTDAWISELSTAYSGIDVRGECRKAHAWIKANIGRRKTARGMKAFLQRWIANAVDSPRAGARPAPVQTNGAGRAYQSSPEAIARARRADDAKAFLLSLDGEEQSVLLAEFRRLDDANEFASLKNPNFHEWAYDTKQKERAA